jgi:hypothetical protein
MKLPRHVNNIHLLLFLFVFFFVDCILFKSTRKDEYFLQFNKKFYNFLIKENKLKEVKRSVINLHTDRLKFITDHGWINKSITDVDKNKVNDNIRSYGNSTMLNVDEDIRNKMKVDNIKGNRSFHFLRHDSSHHEHGNKFKISNNKTRRTNYTFYDYRSYDYAAVSRTTRFYFSLSNECNSLINDTILYKESNNSDIDYIEHLLLNNNVDSIEPKGVFSQDVDINLFIYNRKFNLFTVFFNKNSSDNSDGYSLEYVYSANNIIKSKLSDSNQFKEQNYSDSEGNYNTFTWKFYNDNIERVNQKVIIEFYFNVDRLFEKERVLFNHNSKQVEYSKHIVTEKNKRRVVYKWTGEIKSNEVLIVDGIFPHYFEQCDNIRLDFVMIIVGSIFILLMIVILYIVLSQIFKMDEF